jgi:SAM-dependent methyltransferase
MDARLRAYLDVAAGSDAEFVERMYALLVRRAADPPAFERAVSKLGDGTLSRATLIRELVASDEFERVAAIDDALAFAAAARRDGARPRGLRAPHDSDERPIEIPWALSRHTGEPRTLDVGYAFAEPGWLAGLLALDTNRLVGVDRAEREVPPLESVRADVRALPFDDASFDIAFCISTLEHVGLDNSIYGVDEERDDEGQARALHELRRVLAADGRLIVTVPTGEAEDHGWQIVRPPEDWIELFEAAGFLVFEDELYELGEDGWRTATGFVATGVRYGDRGPGASAVLCAELRPKRVRERLRLALRDARHAREPRRSTRGD